MVIEDSVDKETRGKSIEELARVIFAYDQDRPSIPVADALAQKLYELGYRKVPVLPAPAHIENAEWKYKVGCGRGRGHSSLSRKLLQSIEIGEVKRLYHNDINCHHREVGQGGYNCGILKARDVLRRKDFYFRIYHEAEHVCIIARVSKEDYYSPRTA